MGGTSLLGGWGGYGSTIIGVLVLTTLASLLVGLGLKLCSAASGNRVINRTSNSTLCPFAAYPMQILTIILYESYR